MTKTDITIIGAGLVGITAACALANLGFDITVIDSADLNEARKKEADGRTSAIAAGSADFFKKIGVWDLMLPHAGKINDIRVTDNNSSFFLHYDHALIGHEPMGYIIENYHIREALFNKASEYKNINIIAPAKYHEIEFQNDNCTISICEQPNVKQNFSDSLQHNEKTYNITTKLLLAADGKNSNIRKIAGIGTNEWSYNQSGIVCTIEHEKHHQFTAQERFLPEGPFAVLPMRSENHSSLVWTEKTSLVSTYLSMTADEIAEQITFRTGEYLGKIKLASNMFSYPLSLCKAKTYIGKNLCLIGDAAHAMHPLAGQGFNIGIRDVIQLYKQLEILKSTETNTLIIDSNFFDSYEKSRMADSIALIGITDILNRAFSNNILPIRTIRRLGMGAVNHINPLKKFFMKHAMGVE